MAAKTHEVNLIHLLNSQHNEDSSPRSKANNVFLSYKGLPSRLQPTTLGCVSSGSSLSSPSCRGSPRPRGGGVVLTRKLQLWILKHTLPSLLRAFASHSNHEGLIPISYQPAGSESGNQPFLIMQGGPHLGFSPGLLHLPPPLPAPLPSWKIHLPARLSSKSFPPCKFQINTSLH